MKGYNKFDELTYTQTWSPATGQDMWSNAGGYGFWCNKACAERKDEEKELSQREREAEIEAQRILTEELAKEAPMRAGMGAGKVIAIIFGALALLGVGAYFILRKKK